MDLKTVAHNWSRGCSYKEDFIGKRGSDKINHGNLNEYEAILSRHQNKKINILEIGVAYGGSLGIWKDYFPNGKIYGVDKHEYYKSAYSFPFVFDDKKEELLISRILDSSTFRGWGDQEMDKLLQSVNAMWIPVHFSNKLYEDERIKVDVFDSLDKKSVDAHSKNNFYNFIIDDGSHLLQDQIQTFCNFYPKLKTNGTYFIEDIENKTLHVFNELFKDYPVKLFTQKRESMAIIKKTKKFDFKTFCNDYYLDEYESANKLNLTHNRLISTFFNGENINVKTEFLNFDEMLKKAPAPLASHIKNMEQKLNGDMALLVKIIAQKTEKFLKIFSHMHTTSNKRWSILLSLNNSL
jgi:hypothetical protein